MGVNVRNDHGTAITFLRERVHNAATNSIIAGKLPAWEMLLKEEHDSRGRHWATWTDRKTVRHRRTSKQGLVVAIPTTSSRRSEPGQSSRMSKGSVESHQRRATMLPEESYALEIGSRLLEFVSDDNPPNCLHEEVRSQLVMTIGKDKTTLSSSTSPEIVSR